MHVLLVPVTSLTRWRRSRKTQVRAKPLPPVRVRKDGDEEVEMDSLMDTAAAAEDKDDYYFEDPSNISTGPLPPDLQGVTHCLIWSPSQ